MLNNQILPLQPVHITPITEEQRLEQARIQIESMRSDSNPSIALMAKLCSHHLTDTNTVEIAQQLLSVAAKKDPVPTWVVGFCSAMAEGGVTMTGASEAAGISWQRVGYWFALNNLHHVLEAIKSNAEDATLKKLVNEAYRRGLEKSDNLLMFAIKKLDPSYRDQSGGLTVNVNPPPTAWTIKPRLVEPK